MKTVGVSSHCTILGRSWMKIIGTNGICEDMSLIKEIGQTLKRKLHDHIFVVEVK